ncbi:MAG: hypothetical protein HY537_16655 [Deltaproteobacteria bacterium]|nr:hypothetical protein [Deltaproteobacteria bacterium]
MQTTTRYLFGEWVDDGQPLTAEDVIRICERAEAQRYPMARLPLDKVFSILDEVRKKWENPSYSLRREVLELLPEATGFSSDMIEIGLRELSFIFNTDFLQKKLDTELRDIPRLGDFRFYPSSKSALRWQPIGIVLHVLAGNVFVGAAGSLVEGLITGNVTILKMASSEKIFLPRLIQSLRECDREGVISRSIALLDYSSSQADVIAEFKKRVDGIVVWGGEQAVKGYRSDLPARTRFIVFGPKLSLALVTKNGLLKTSVDEIAQSLAKEIAFWDQNACTAPQLCYVEGHSNAVALTEILPEKLERITRSLPPGSVEPDQAIEIRKLRTVFEIAEARGEGILKQSSEKLDWTVVLDKNPSIEPSPLHRTLRIVPFENISDVVSNMENLRGYLQTIGLASTDQEFFSLSGRLAETGALRIFRLGEMAEGEIDDPHDGSYDLPLYMNLVVTRTPRLRTGLSPVDILLTDERANLINSRLRTLVTHARRSEFYAKRLDSLSIETIEDLIRIPTLDRETMEANMPPVSRGLCTTEWKGGYLTRSGGSTGEPKFSIHDGKDWDALVTHGERVFRALGLGKGDRVANCMLAGDLYGSFVSFDHINCRVGVNTFALSDKASPEVFVRLWKQFKLNVIQGMPGKLVPFLRTAKDLEPQLTIQKVIYAGSPLSPIDYLWIRNELKAERIASVIGANDGGQFAFQCEHMSGSRHHTLDDFNYLEIVDDEGKPVPAGEEGKIVITSLLKLAFPLIRYEIGDKGRFLPSECRCGRTNRIIEYLGRSDDCLSMGLMNLRYADLLKALSDFPISQMQMIARNDVQGETLIIRIESEAQGEQWSTKTRDTLIHQVPYLGDRLKDGSLAGLIVEWYRPGYLPRNPRSGKVKSVVDERK